MDLPFTFSVVSIVLTLLTRSGNAADVCDSRLGKYSIERSKKDLRNGNVMFVFFSLKKSSF